MAQPIVYLDRSRIRPGGTARLKEGVEGLIAFIESREPQLVSYGFSFDDETDEMTVVAVHPDSRSLALHLDVGSSAFRELAGLLDLLVIEVFGSPETDVIARLQQKAEMLGDGAQVLVRPWHAGFARLTGVSARSAGSR